MLMRLFLRQDYRGLHTKEFPLRRLNWDGRERTATDRAEHEKPGCPSNILGQDDARRREHALDRYRDMQGGY